MEWQPIETAPKDGTVILLMQARNRICITGRWSDEYKHWSTGCGPMAYLDGATHWASLDYAVKCWEESGLTQVSKPNIHSKTQELAAWVSPVAARILDMIPFADLSEAGEDRIKLRHALETAFAACPAAIEPLIGTEVIEETYFEDLAKEEEITNFN